MHRFVSARAARHMVSVCLLLAAAACSSSSDGGGAPVPVEVTPDAAAPAHDAGTPPTTVDAYVAPTVDANLPPAFVSNIPGVTVKDVGSPPTPNLLLISANFTQQPSGGQVYQEWLGEVENVGSTVVCDVQLQLTYEDANGATVVAPQLNPFVDSDPYAMPGYSSSIPCLAPGKIGTFWTNEFANSMADTSRVKTIAVKFGSLSEANVAPDPNAPTIAAHVSVTGLGYEIQGTMAAAAAPIHNVGVHLYPRDATGLVLTEFPATDLGALEPGSPYPFSTSGISTPYAQFRAFASYIEGASRPVPREPTPLDRIAAERRATQAAIEARAARR